MQVHWASEQVVRGDHLSDQQLVETISKRLSAGSVPTADVASTAFNHNRRDLARLLLDLEPKAADQVCLMSRFALSNLVR